MTIQYARDGPIGRITLSHPPRNALASPVFADGGELAAFLGDPTLKAAVLSGAGRHFCAGADPETLRQPVSRPDSFAAALDQGKALIATINFAPVPVLALIRGACLGAGLEIALACHFRFASEGTLLGFPEVEHGLLPGLGGTALGLDAVARATLVELVLSGRMVGAAEAMALGLVDRSVPGDRLEGEAMGFLRSLTARRPARLVHAVMAAIHAGRRLPLEQALRRETELLRQVVRDGEADNG